MNIFLVVVLHLFQVPPTAVGPHMVVGPPGDTKRGHMAMVDGKVINTI